MDPDVASIVVASAPGRVNLIGEHLDYNGGRCLPIAIGLRTTAAIGPAPGSEHQVHSDVQPVGWTDYVVGTLAELEVDVPLAVTVTSDVPVGAGLSSSAALTCSVAVAANELLDLGRTREQLAAAAIRAENDHVGVPTGGMDQAASLFGEAGKAVLLDFDAGTLETVPWRPEDAGLRLLVVDTRVRHRLVDGGYADRRTDCEAAAASLGLVWLAQATQADLTRLTGIQRRRAEHVVSEQRRVDEVVAAAGAGDWTAVGAAMTASHASLRDDFQVSCDELDTVVEAGRRAGALGARMTGGGFGGSAVVLVARDRLDDVRTSLTDAFTRHGWDTPTVIDVEASRGAEVATSARPS